MYRNNTQKLLVVFIFFVGISVLFLFGKSYAAPPTVKLVQNPNKTDVPVGSRKIAITAIAGGSNLTFKWELLGSGEFQGPPDSPAIFYIPPDSIDEESEQAIIIIRISDDEGQEATDSIVFNIISEVPTPEPTSFEEKKPSEPKEKKPSVLVLKQASTRMSGKKVEGSSGKIVYHDHSKRVFSGTIELKGLESEHEYVLTLNGKPSHSSNDLLKEFNKTKDGQGYYDFHSVTTDLEGNVTEAFEVSLSPGAYRVKFFIKDVEDKWKPVLYHDNLNFTVSE